MLCYAVRLSTEEHRVASTVLLVCGTLTLAFHHVPHFPPAHEPSILRLNFSAYLFMKIIYIFSPSFPRKTAQLNNNMSSQTSSDTYWVLGGFSIIFATLTCAFVFSITMAMRATRSRTRIVEPLSANVTITCAQYQSSLARQEFRAFFEIHAEACTHRREIAIKASPPSPSLASPPSSQIARIPMIS